MQVVNQTVSRKNRDIGAVQFGEGNFLRGFVDYMIDISNEKGVTDLGVAIVKPISFGSLDLFRAQDSVYTVVLRGRQDGQTVENRRVVTSVERVVDAYTEYEEYMALAKLDSLKAVISNTTEAGIVYDETDTFDAKPAKSFPGKLTQFLYARWQAFGGDSGKGLIILPVELIEANGEKLRGCVEKLAGLWKLPEAFQKWLLDDNIFCNTLVDRIITGYPKDEAAALCESWGYKDDLIVTGEPFALWVIESGKPDFVAKTLPLDKAGVGVIYTDDITPYRERKVRVLNGAHTGTVLGAYLAGLNTVGECMNDETVRAYMEKMMYDEIVPNVKLPRDEVMAFARAVVERFENPFIKHNLLSIALNSVSKWKSRILPSLLDTKQATGKLPEQLTFSFAALMAFYSSDKFDGDSLVGTRDGDGANYQILDDRFALDFFAENCKLPVNEFVRKCASNTAMWGRDLSEIEGFCDKVSGYLTMISEKGARAAMQAAAGK